MAKRPRKENIMATINTTTANTVRTSTKKHAFTFDHINKQIVGTDINFQKAGIPGSDLEAELNALMEARPSYSLYPTPTEKKPAKKTYAGLTMEVMEAYLAIYEGELAAEMRVEFAKMKAKKAAKKMSYPTIKSWFLDQFPHINVNKAKKAIQDHKLKEAKAPHQVVKVSISIPKSANQHAEGND